jgi:hypothetical protein
MATSEKLASSSDETQFKQKEKDIIGRLRDPMLLFQDRPSLLSSDAGPANFRGILNLTIILMVRGSSFWISHLETPQVITNFNLVVGNAMQYGFLPRLHLLVTIEWYRWPAIMIGLGNILSNMVSDHRIVACFFPLVAFGIEKAVAAKKIVSQTNIAILQALNILALVVLPSNLIWVIQPNPGLQIKLGDV